MIKRISILRARTLMRKKTLVSHLVVKGASPWVSISIARGPNGFAPIATSGPASRRISRVNPKSE